jgi:hypothetical protein
MYAVFIQFRIPATSREENQILKEPLKKRRHLARSLTSLVSAALFHKLLKNRAHESAATEDLIFLPASAGHSPSSTVAIWK